MGETMASGSSRIVFNPINASPAQDSTSHLSDPRYGLLPDALFRTMPAPGANHFARQELTGEGSQPVIQVNLASQFLAAPPPAPISKSAPPPNTPQDPSDIPLDGKYFDDQWHFDFLGDIEKIWEEYSGAGVHVGVYDDAVDTDHPDLIGNYDASLEVLVDGQVLDGNGGDSLGGWAHGTAVAGLIAASRNDFGTTGVAWGSFITGVPVLDMGVRT
jgi:subtilisin family serine protease